MTSQTNYIIFNDFWANYIIFRNEKKLENNIKHVIKRCVIEKEIFHNSDFNSNLP
jgi:hypothetical protein